MITNTKNLLLFLLSKYIGRINSSVDMTSGNGHDSRLIIEEKKPYIHYAFDIQAQAKENTLELLNQSGIDLSRFRFILDSHAKLKKYVEEKIDLFIYNLGYLPAGDHMITTRAKDVIESLNQALTLLNDGGHILITFYPGHPEGKNEAEEVVSFLMGLDQRAYNIIKFDFINQVNNPPFVIMVEKRL